MLFRPADCDRMAAATRATLAFVEDPSVGGSRTHSTRLLLSAIGIRRDSVPDMGVGPKALLLHAVDHPIAEGTALPFTSLDTWLAVGARSYAPFASALLLCCNLIADVEQSVFSLPMGVKLQSLHPPLTATAVEALCNYIEGDVFRCSCRMAVEDLAIALSEDTVMSVPGLPAVAVVTLQAALRIVKLRIMEQLSRPSPVRAW